MKHLQKSNSFRGAGVTLYPPSIGNFKTISTFETSEVIDLICDGPIEGLVNSKGSVLNESSYLQGVYLNGVPIQNTSDDFIEQTSDVLAEFGRTAFVKELGALVQKLYWGKSPGDMPLWGPRPGGTGNVYKLNLWNYSWSDFDDNVETRWTKHLAKNGEPSSWMSMARGDYVTSAYNSRRIKCGSSSCWVGQYAYSVLNRNCFSTNYGKHRLEKDLTSLGYSRDSVKLASSNTSYDQASITRNYLGYYFSAGRGSYYPGGLSTTNQSVAEFANGYLWLLGDRELFGIESDTFWHKNIDNWYVEVSLNETFSFEAMFQSNGYPVNRNKIIDGINDIVNKNNEVNANRFARQFISGRLKKLGISNSKLENLSFNDIKELIKKELNERRPHYLYSGGSDPYLFISHNTNVFEGYVEADHKRIFIDEKRYIENFEEAKQYVIDDRFYSNGVYYRVQASGGGFLGTEQDIINDQAIVEKENRKLAIVTDTKDQVLWESSLGVFRSNAAADFTSRSSVGNKYFDFLMPVLDDAGEWYGEVFGFTIENLNTGVLADKTPRFQTAGHYEDGSGGYTLWKTGITYPSAGNAHTVVVNGMSKSHLDLYGSKESSIILSTSSSQQEKEVASKYNFGNVLVEFRNGENKQDKLNNFKDIFIDKPYGQILLGPYSVVPKSGSGGLQRLYWNSLDGVFPKMRNRSTPPDMDPTWLSAYSETSDDDRTVNGDQGAGQRDFSNWSKFKNYNEEASPIVHVVNNPTVEQCFVTLDILQLYDTSEDEQGETYNQFENRVGGNIPAPLNIRVEVGLIDQNGEQQEFYARYFQIITLITSATAIDLGNPYNTRTAEYVKQVNPFSLEDDESAYQNADLLVNDPFVLPSVSDFNGEVADSTEREEDSKINRYLKITKLNVETTSSLMKRKVNLNKVTEVIPLKCSYPFSSIVGTKTNSQSFDNIPVLTFRCKLKKIQIPSNYSPIQNQKDIRYWGKDEDFKKEEKSKLSLYKGDWDGTFTFAWSDNPAWILYDMLVSTRYGLGSDIRKESINKWQLYEIGRFCDSVDEDGYFEGVEDGRGGREPRFSCNIIFEEDTKIFDAISSISALFRGVIYYSNGALTFRDDRLTSPVAIFNNENVREGVFSYSNYKKEEVYNAVEVIYKDKFNDYKTKVEYVEDQEDITKRGIFKKTFTAIGVTSKAMAKRAAYHIMVQTTKENESVSFITGTEALLCNPGDLIVVDDSMKSLEVNYGRILDIDLEKNTLRLTGKYNNQKNNKEIKVFVPNESQTIEDIEDLLSIDRSRVDEFSVKAGVSQDFNNDFAGDYEFSNYELGFEDSEDENTLTQYPLFLKNNDDSLIYYSTGYSGWVFAVGGKKDTDEEIYDKYILKSNIFNLGDITDPRGIDPIDLNIHVYDVNQPDRRGSILESASGKFLNEFEENRLDFFGGVLSKEIQTDSAVQIQTFKILNNEVDGDREYGDLIYLDDEDPNINLLQFVPKGSSYRLGINDASERIYKISTIKEEESDNTYAISASKYYSGKYKEIEEGFNEKEKENTYGHDSDLVSIGDKIFTKLDTPNVTYSFKNDGDLFPEVGQTYYISGFIGEINNATGYLIEYTDPDYVNETQVTPLNSFYKQVSVNGYHNIKVKALSDGFNNSNLNNVYIDSEFQSKSVRVFIPVEQEEPDALDSISVSNVVVEDL